MKEKWKRAFEIDPESTPETKRVEITAKRKAWLVRAWIHYFGFLPNAIPVYNERQGFFHTPGIKIQYHHVVPIGESTRIYGEDHEIYNDPRNLVPVSALNHIGDGAGEEDTVLHPDTQEAKKNYRTNKNSYQDMGTERRKMTDAGLIYHNPEYDEYLLDLADQVVSTYQRDFPQDKY